MKIKTVLMMAMVFLLPIVTFAAGGLVPCDGVAGPDGTGVVCNFCSLMILAQNILQFVIMASASIAVVMFAYAGVLYVTNGGDTAKITKAHGIFTSVFVGVIIILIAWLVVDVLIKTFTDDAKMGPWNKIECSTTR